MEYYVLLYYKYQHVPDPNLLEESQRTLCQSLGLKGRVRVSEEGINGTLGGSRKALEAYTEVCSKVFPEVDWKFSRSDIDAFDNLRVRKVESLVSRTAKVKYDAELCGVPLTPEEFHAHAQDHAAVLIDVRNSYEFAIGHFEGAVNPDTRNFARFSSWLSAERNGLLRGKTKFLMYCTGGIRCETASIELRRLAPKRAEVYMLSGGIHRYLEKYGTGGKFKGKNFVFDKRITQQVDLDSCMRDKNASESDVVGHCSQCKAPFDEINPARRCKKCRVLLLVCDNCDVALRHTYFCDEHKHLDPKDVNKNLVTLQTYAADLVNKINSLHLLGRRNKAKRQTLNRQLSEIRSLLAAATDQSQS